MAKKLINKLPILGLLIFAILTRFLFLAYPPEIVFDEVHFGKFVSSYFSHQYYFDIHPPLGKMIIAGFFWVFNKASISEPEKAFLKIGENLDKNILFSFRFLPAFFGTLFVILVYELILSFGLSKKAAFLGAFLILFDNAFLVESKFILVDIFLVFFGALSLYLYFLYRKNPSLSLKSIIFLTLSAIFSAFAFSIKWTGLSFYFLIVVVFLIDAIRSFTPLEIPYFKENYNKNSPSRESRKFLTGFKLKDFIIKISIIIFLPFLVYFLIFAVHFKILSKPGSGDAFMSQNFQNLNLWQKFVELNKTMLKSNAGIKTSHPYSSKWFQWPIIKKPIWYWTKNLNSKIGNIYLLGNPLVWWSALASVIFSFWVIFWKKTRKKLTLLFYFFLFGYFINLLPYIVVGRVTFLYHYLPSLLFGIFILVFFMEKIISPKNKKAIKPYKVKLGKIKKENKKEFLTFPSKFYFSLYIIFLAVVFLSFLAFLPLTYGFLISPKLNEIYNIFIKFLS